MKIITFEEHFMSAKVNEAYTNIFMKTATPAACARAKFIADFVAGDDSLTKVDEKRIAFMDKSGVDIQVVSYGNNSPMHLAAGDAVPLCRQANDELAGYIAKHPSRFLGFAALPMADARAASEELSRCVNDLGFKGAMLAGTLNDRFFDAPEFFPVFEKAAELDVPIYFHPGEVNEQIADYYYRGNWPDAVSSTLAGYAFGWHVDIGIHVMRMILSGIFDKLPGLKLISGHWGELVPYFFERIDESLPPSMTKLARNFSEYYKEQVYVTPSGMYYDAPFQLCMSEMGADHILWSMDYPYMKRENAGVYLEHAAISQEDKEKIGYRNAEKLLRL